MNKCNEKCSNLGYGKHLVEHIDEALQLRGSQYTKEQVVNGFQGMLGGGEILPSEYNILIAKTLDYYNQ